MLEEDCQHVPPYSPREEVRFFFKRGIPLGLASFLNWGLPPLMGMIFAGHTEQSAHLQASLGYGRVWFNCTVLMPLFGFCAYMSSAIPGCIGANRHDRIPSYFQRSTFLIFLFMLPTCALQFFSGSIMECMGVPQDNAADVRDFSVMMIVASALIVLSSHLETICINLGYVKSAMANSFVTGLGVDIASTYFFISKWQWGIYGAALAQITVQLSRLIVWLVLMLYFGILRKSVIVPAGGEKLFSVTELRQFLKLGIPQIFSFFSGWLIFEFQMIAITNIEGISKDALAAGAIWVQLEQTLAAAQDGWIRSTSMRSLNLLGKLDPDAPKGFLIFNILAVVVVAFTNLPVISYRAAICSLVSNDAAVQSWLYNLVPVLIAHALTRVVFCNSANLYVPLGKGMLGTAVTFVTFYCIATPIALTIALTNLVTHAVWLKMLASVAASTIAQTCGTIFNCTWLWRLNWHQAGMIIHNRANMDKDDLVVSLATVEAPAHVLSEGAMLG